MLDPPTASRKRDVAVTVHKRRNNRRTPGVNDLGTGQVGFVAGTHPRDSTASDGDADADLEMICAAVGHRSVVKHKRVHAVARHETNEGSSAMFGGGQRPPDWERGSTAGSVSSRTRIAWILAW